MEITEVQVKVVGDSADRLKASCSVTIDGEFVIRDVKVIEGTNGLFVAMPSRKLTDHCPKCRYKNHLRAQFCNHCGSRLGEDRAMRRGGGPVQLHADIAHPINSGCRERIQNRVIEEYLGECERECEHEGEREMEPVSEHSVEIEDDDRRDGKRDDTHEDSGEDVRQASTDATDATDATEEQAVDAASTTGGEIGDLIEELKQDARERRSEPANAPVEAPVNAPVEAPATTDREGEQDEFGAGLL